MHGHMASPETHHRIHRSRIECRSQSEFHHGHSGQWQRSVIQQNQMFGKASIANAVRCQQLAAAVLVVLSNCDNQKLAA